MPAIPFANSFFDGDQQIRDGSVNRYGAFFRFETIGCKSSFLFCDGVLYALKSFVFVFCHNHYVAQHPFGAMTGG